MIEDSQDKDLKNKTGSIFSGKVKKSPQAENQTKALQPHPDFVTLPVIPIRDGVLFPHTESVLTFGRKLSINAVKAAEKINRHVILLAQKEGANKTPKASDLFQVGTLAVIDRTLTTEGQVNALVRGVGRVKIERFVSYKPTMIAAAQKLHDQVKDQDKLKGLASHLQKLFRRSLQVGKPVEFLNFMKLMSGVNQGELVDQVASTLSGETIEKQNILEELLIEKRLELVIESLTKEIKVLEIEHDVASKTQKKFDKRMRENVLRERMETIQRELGEIDEEEELAQEYEAKLKKAKIKSKSTRDKISKEIKRLRAMSPNNPEAGYVRSWLDTIFELPWSNSSRTTIDLTKAEKILNQHHFGLEKVKDRILEFMAVLKLQKAAKHKQVSPTILCFVGPPGVGKTSIGKSIAQALNREFVKVSLGGIRDEAEIRGHRRTYVGAMPGRIINGLKQAGSFNPVFMLDEIDKVGLDFRGDPSSALLEALDPEQNHEFEDHYLDVPFDLSQVLFITTANTLDTIPPALRDRLEIVRYSGYTQEEKLHIAQDHLWQKLLTRNGLVHKQLSITNRQLDMVISRYTREAGVRDLERQLGTIMRKAARKLISDKKIDTIEVSDKVINDYLGPAKFDETLTENQDQVGLATGLAWTSVGGDMLFIEVALVPGKGNVKLTGKLGDVMKESAQAALTYVKANATELGIDQTDLEKFDVHVHVPEGAVPKDGPSAGITIATAIVSAFTKRKVKRHVAMTGEVTLRGRVLRIGGLKEKAIAAHRGGVKTILIPAENERDLIEVPTSVKEQLEFTPVRDVSEVLEKALVWKQQPRALTFSQVLS